MKQVISILLLVLFYPVVATAQEMDSTAMMEAYMQAGTPGANHELLEPMTGDWDVTSRFRMSPDAEWMSMTAEAEAEWVLDGRFVKQEVHSEGMAMSDMAFEGVSIMGYDNTAEEFVSVWMDNHSTMMMIGTGTADESGAITLTGEYSDPMSGSMKDFTWIYKPADGGGFTMEMYEPGPDGEDFLSGEITYTR